MPHGRLVTGGRRVNESNRALRPSAPPSVRIAVLIAGALGGLLLVGVEPGLNWILVAAAVAAAAGRRALTWDPIIFGGLSLALVATALYTSSASQLIVNLLVALGVASLAAAPARTWIEVAVGFGAAGWRMPAALGWILRRTHRPSSPAVTTGTLRVVRGLALGGLLLVVFGTLFASADRAFAQLADEVLRVPPVDFGLLPARLVVAVVVGVFAAALASFAPGLEVGRGGPIEWVDGLRSSIGVPRRRRLGRTEWATALVMLDALFLLFVIVQITVLFGGRDHVLDTAGLTYAQYARSGFFQLVAVAGLTLLVLGFFARYAQRSSPRDDLLLKVLGGALLVLTLVVLASALKRLVLYEEVFGLTRLRVAVHASILWLTGMFAIVSVAGFRMNARWLPRAAVVVSTASLLAFTLVRPDALIAEHNVERFERTGRIDVSYLAGLSPDAVPALATLPEPERTCALAALRYELAEPTGIWALNFARDAARKVLSNTPESASSLAACPYS